MHPERVDQRQRDISDELGISRDFDPINEISRRVAFISNYLRQSKTHFLILGISGGIDSATAGRMAQLAVRHAREQGYSAQFIAMRLPYGIQRDENDAQSALQFIEPDRTVYVDVKPASDAMLASVAKSGLEFRDASHEDFVLGNIKARQRMIAQYAVANAHNGLVIGTDHAAEALMGFFTKYGDGACDLAPLAGLNKRRIRSIASALGAPAALVRKVPMADLENLAPQRPDEEAYGITYDQIDDFLEGKRVSEAVYETIFRFYDRTAHKRALPAEPSGGLPRNSLDR